MVYFVSTEKDVYTTKWCFWKGGLCMNDNLMLVKNLLKGRNLFDYVIISYNFVAIYSWNKQLNN